jgi:tellurite resistance protein
MEFYPEIPIDEHQAQSIARGLCTVAAADGVHEREMALIAAFYGSAAEGQPRHTSSLAELSRLGPLAPAELAAALPNSTLRELFVKTAILLAYADGSISNGERTQIQAYADALHVSEKTQVALEESVRDHMMAPLARLSNMETVSKVASKLGRR